MSGSVSAALTAPFFEIGPKNLLRLPAIIEMTRAAVRSGDVHGVSVIVTVPTALIVPVRQAVPGALVFAQTMDADEPGPSVGRVTAESLVDAGADGVMLNHDAAPLDTQTLRRTLRRAAEAGLRTMVCAGTDAQVLELAELDPTIVLYEPPELIGRAGGGQRPWIPAIDERVHATRPDVLMMHAGGVSEPDDAFEIMSAGAQGTGVTSGVVRAASRPEAAARFIAAVRRGYDRAGAVLSR